MTAHCILKRFELVTDTPGNIPLLRRFVIDLAVRGKLIEKSCKDEYGTEILMRIAAKKELLTKDGKIKKQKPLLPIAEGDVPTMYSAHCVFERLANVALLEKGLTGIQSAEPGQYPLVVTAEIRSSCDHFDFEGAAAIIPMVSSTGHGHASLNRLHYQEGKFALGNILCAVFPISDDLISARFLYEYLTAFKNELLVSKMIGTANVSLTIGKIGEVPVPIVSPTVQRRVDKLMALCDRLEVAQAERESRRDRLVAASLHRLNKGAYADALRDHGRFYFNHLPRLTMRSEHIQQLRQTILNLAVRGKLVRQDPSEEPATHLLVQLTANAKSYALEHSIAPPNPDPITKENIDCPAPPGWKWVRLASLFKVITDGDHQPPPKADDGIAFLTIGNITTGKLDFTNCRFVGEKYWKSLTPYKKPAFGDILYTVVGATYGRPAYVDTRRHFCVQRHIAILKPTDQMNVRFLWSLLASPLVYEQATRSTTGTAQPTIPIRPLRNFLVLLPPLAEQQRIVAKVDELMALCDRLEAQLTTTQTESRRLLDAILHVALSQEPTTATSRPTQSSPGMVGAHTSSASTGRPNKHFARTLLSAEIIHQLHAEPTFGRTKHQKILHLCEHVAQIEEVSGEYYRQAAGPLDNRLIYSVEAELKKQRWYEEYRRPQYGHGYRPLEKAGGHLKYLERYWPDKLSAVRRLIDIMRTWDTDHCEMFATAYAAWNDLLIWKREPTDKAILDEILGRWHERKKRFSETQWRAVIAWIRKEGFIPVGFGRPTKQLANP